MSVAHSLPLPAGHQHAEAPAAAPLVQARALVAGFDAARVFGPLDLDVHAGETVAIVGRSGGGKTTLLHVLAGLHPAASGELAAEPAALMPQRDGLMPWASARDNAALPLRVAGMARREAHAAATAQLDALGLAGVARRRVAELSGGMRQRVALARTLLTGRRLLLLDEPLAAVDALTRSELHALLLEHLACGGHGAVLVTHDLDEAMRLADRILVLRGGQLIDGPVLAGTPGDAPELRGGEALRLSLREALNP